MLPCGKRADFNMLKLKSEYNKEYNLQKQTNKQTKEKYHFILKAHCLKSQETCLHTQTILLIFSK